MTFIVHHLLSSHLLTTDNSSWTISLYIVEVIIIHLDYNSIANTVYMTFIFYLSLSASPISFSFPFHCVAQPQSFVFDLYTIVVVISVSKSQLEPYEHLHFGIVFIQCWQIIFIQSTNKIIELLTHNDCMPCYLVWRWW